MEGEYVTIMSLYNSGTMEKLIGNFIIFFLMSLPYPFSFYFWKKKNVGIGENPQPPPFSFFCPFNHIMNGFTFISFFNPNQTQHKIWEVAQLGRERERERERFFPKVIFQ